MLTKFELSSTLSLTAFLNVVVTLLVLTTAPYPYPWYRIGNDLCSSNSPTYPSPDTEAAIVALAYTGLDFPIDLPLPLQSTPHAQITLQESVQFTLNGPQSFDIWDVLENYLPSFGWVRLGPRNRWFAVVMHHQLHCLRQFQHGIQGLRVNRHGPGVLDVNRDTTTTGNHHDANHTTPTPAHIQHCLHYLRQNILCAADASLEVGDSLQRNFALDRNMGDAVCEDWSALDEFGLSNWERWAAIRGPEPEQDA